MVQDLSYLTEQPSEEQEQSIRDAVATECIRAIAIYLEEVADTMDSNSILTLNSATVRAMSAEFYSQLPENTENHD